MVPSMRANMTFLPIHCSFAKENAMSEAEILIATMLKPTTRSVCTVPIR